MKVLFCLLASDSSIYLCNISYNSINSMCILLFILLTVYSLIMVRN